MQYAWYRGKGGIIDIKFKNKYKQEHTFLVKAPAQNTYMDNLQNAVMARDNRLLGIYSVMLYCPDSVVICLQAYTRLFHGSLGTREDSLPGNTGRGSGAV